jgi:coenzyme Q-binding protein COQ10
MPHFETRRKVPHSAEQMFDLVADVERYPEFVPFCERLEVRARRREGEREVLIASMAVGYKLLRESFTSKVTLERPALTIRADYLDGPFRTMENRWAFTPRDAQRSEIFFCIHYEFRSRTLDALMGRMFDRVFRHFAHAFEARADAVYGTPAEAGHAARQGLA